MRDVKNILNHLSLTPSFAMINRYSSFDRFKKILPKRFQSAISFIYQKDRTLFLVLNHQGIHMELNYNRTLIKDLLTLTKKHDENFKDIDDVKWFVSNKTKREDAKERTIVCYPERASEDFIYKSDDLEMEKRAQKIRELIKINRCKES